MKIRILTSCGKNNILLNGSFQKISILRPPWRKWKTGLPPSVPGWNPCKPHAEDAPRLSKYHAKVFGMTPQKPKTKQNTPSTSTIYAGTRQNLRSHASTPRISKLHAEDLRRDIHRFHPGLCGHPRTTEVHVNLKFFCTTPRMAQISTVGYRSFLGRPNSYAHL